MFSLLIPVAGKSSRFPNMRPKWLLTMPDGKLMVEKSVELINLKKFDRVIITCLKEHLEKYASEALLISSFELATGVRPEFVILDEPTGSQSETIYKTLIDAKVDGAFVIKDCDNMFYSNPEPENFISTINLSDVGLIDAKNKSYVELDSVGHVTNIIEKEVISNEFCCGGYGFESAEEFKRAFLEIGGRNEEIYVSHVIYHLLLGGADFRSAPSNSYVDWGTEREYRGYCSKHLTLFCDVDGVLLENGSKFGEKGWLTAPLKGNLKKISDLQASGGVYLVLTSSRPEEMFSYVEGVLEENGVKVDAHLFGLPHTKRILINDFSRTNPYPTALAINLERNARNLDEYIDHLVK
jgi:hypothetical protein